MGKLVTPEARPSVDAGCKSAIEQYVGKMKVIQIQMNKDQNEIEALRAETDATLAGIMQTLKVIQSR